MMTGFSKRSRAALAVLVLCMAGTSAPAFAQSSGTVSRAVVQPLPPAAADDLNAALMRLARDRRDVDALISAGLASLELDDVDAAIGFFGRAKELSPQNPRIAEGMGAAYVRGGRPVEALKFFEEAEQAGIRTGSLWADRGLAYDLVGENQAAQEAYRRALSLEDDTSVRQRLALSYAIAGDRQSFEDTLRPLLDQRDFAAYRTRAFGLATLGQADDAIEIARAVMPRDLAGRMEPYLRFMPRLTKSQQAAAANLGIYPSASRIGRDDPRIASAAGTPGTGGTSDTALEPRGAPLGNAGGAPETARVARNSLPNTAALERTDRARGQLPPPVETEPAPQAPAQPAAVRIAEATPEPQPQAPGLGVTEPAETTATLAASPAEGETVQLASVDLGQPESRGGQPVEFDLSDGQGDEPAGATQAGADTAPAGQMNLADAFADFAEPTTVAVSGEDVVDISTIEPVREEATPPPPPAPRRIWLQLGIGQNRSLLRSDWRLKYRKFDVLKDKGPFVTPWGQTNRLLAGPFESQSAAREALNALSAENIDSFVWTSAEGQAIDDLR